MYPEIMEIMVIPMRGLRLQQVADPIERLTG